MRAILTYHSIDDSGSAISIAPAVFARHVAWLASGRVRVLSLDDLVRARTEDGDAIAVTFDDGFANTAIEAWPRLASHGLPATVFVVTGHVGGVNDWGGRQHAGIPTLPLMTWEMLSRCRDDGLAIGAHTRTHAALPTLGAAQVGAEVAGSCDDLRVRLGVHPTSFAFPYGAFSDAAVRSVRDHHLLGCTTQHRPLRADDDPALLPRLDAWYFRAPGAFDSWGSPGFLARIAARRALRRARTAVRQMAGVR